MCTHTHAQTFATHVEPPRLFSRYLSAKSLLLLYVNTVEFMQTPTQKDVLPRNGLLCHFFYYRKKKHTLSGARSFPRTPPINPPNQQNMFIFHCREFTLGGSSVFTLSLFGLACCYSEAVCGGGGERTDAELIGSRLTVLIRVIKWVNLWWWRTSNVIHEVLIKDPWWGTRLQYVRNYSAAPRQKNGNYSRKI